MNIYKIVDDIQKTDPEATARMSRRDMFKQSSFFGRKVAMASIPVALGGLFKKTYAGTQESVTAVLNFALTLEYLEDEFYKMGLAATSLIPADRKAIFNQVSKHETAHVAFIRSVITSLGATPVSKPTFDFTAKGTYADVFTNYQTFLALSQAFEDTGVRAYKGRAAELQSNDVVLTAALQIHSVEARHASMIRRLRAEKGWITGNMGTPAAVYAGEENVTQGGVDVTTLGYNATIATQAFDEPLAPDRVLAIAGLFIVS
jgi:rubrerythrin